MTNEIWFLLLIFAAVIFLFQSLLISVYSPQKTNTRLLRKHLKKISTEGIVQQADLVLNKKLEKLPGLLRALEEIEFIKNLTYKLQLAGYKMLGHQYALLALLVAALIALLIWHYTLDPLFVFLSILVVLFLFNLQLNRAMNNRLEKIEEQFPEALDVLRRGLQAGYAFSEALKLVYEETQGELSKEFYILFSQINFGTDVKTSLLIFVQRVPITSAMAFASAVSIQKETGGNLAEKIEGLSKIIRQRFAFKRRVRTLSAEGRLSGWVLVLTPFALFAVLYISSPGYIATLTSTPEGIDLLKWGGLGMLFGIFWISKLIKIDL
ncbi:MAG: tight adherence protein B [Psychromonas sp.]|jgi:tight adherence protein B|uniref:type II secretion system F family protein n=1 Tax=Psychromonas sp. TaxID=1884585 RepID=UPI0039E4B2C6